MRRILVTDGMEKSAVQKLKDNGFEVVEQYYEPEALAEAIRDFDGMVVRSKTKVRKPFIDAMAEAGSIKVIVRGGVGVDNIDVSYAEEKGIAVRNTPNASTNSVAEYVIGAMFALARNFPAANSSTHAGQWDKNRFKGVEIKGKTLGIIGCGRIGRRVGEIGKALGMDVIGTDLVQVPDNAGIRFMSFDEVVSQADFLVLTVSGSGDPIITEAVMNQMKKGSFFINSARGSLVDQKAVAQAVRAGQLAGAALDVFQVEPLDDQGLRDVDNILLTPHIAGQTKEGQTRIGDEVADILINFFKED